jgi:hypothetical protein
MPGSIAAKTSVLVVALLCVSALGGCGSSGKPSASGTNLASRGIKFADCMRSHGVPNFPDPSGGGGIKIPVNSGINPFSPAFKQSQSACRNLLPGGGPPPGGAGQAREAMLRTADCMRAHGVSGFPDPTTSPPSNIADFSIAEGRPGAFLAVPSTIDVNSPAFKQAAKACDFG